VYGQVKDFKNTTFGSKLYKFAQEMQIDDLTEEVVTFLKKAKISEYFALFDLYSRTGHKRGLNYCKLVRQYSFCQL
jgi:hypothetical protein